MGCNTCNKSPCGCSGTTCATVPYYLSTPVCPEDNCQKIYCNQFTFGVCPCVSWNVPVGGGTALLQVPGIQGAAIGSYIWNSAYGYFQVVSVDAERGLLGITNTLITGNADPGTQIPKDTCFIVSPPPADTGGNSNFFPYVAIDFTAPANGDCLDITVTTYNGLTVGDEISIGTGFYSIDAMLGNNVITICNLGQGILPGTSVIAQDQFGNYQYPIYVTSSCCASLTAQILTINNDIALIEADLLNVNTVLSNIRSAVYNDTSNGVVGPAAAAANSGTASIVINNASTTMSSDVMVHYDAYFSGPVIFGGGGGPPELLITQLQYSLTASINGGAPLAIITPLINNYPIYDDGSAPASLVMSFAMSRAVSYTIAPGGTLTIDASSQADVLVPAASNFLDTGYTAWIYLRAIEVRT